MQEFYRQQLVPYPAHQMFALVSDVPAYPQFLPLCRAAEVIRWEDQVQIARLEVGRGPLRLGWTTRNQLETPHHILMRLEEGPFRRLEGRWDFTAIDDQASQIALRLRYDLSQSVRGAAQQLLFGQMVQSLINAFIRRAGERYGSEQ